VHTLMLLSAALCYIAASFVFARGISRDASRSDAVSRDTRAAWLLAAGFTLHSLDLVFGMIRAGGLPVADFAGGFSFFAWLVVGLYLAVQARTSLAVVGVIVSPLAFLAASADALLRGDDRVLPEVLRSPWLPVHVTLAFLGNAVFALAFAVSAVFLLQQGLLKSRRGAGLVRRLPALQTLDRSSLVLLLWGFPLLTLGILSGGFWSMTTGGSFWTGEPREILSVVTWLLYAGLLQLRLLGGLHGRNAAAWTIVAFVLLLASWLAVALLGFDGRHGQGLAG
jgi:ABC-type transport system involved in cytochrome c biogenesis permease subunit